MITGHEQTGLGECRAGPKFHPLWGLPVSLPHSLLGTTGRKAKWTWVPEQNPHPLPHKYAVPKCPEVLNDPGPNFSRCYPQKLAHGGFVPESSLFGCQHPTYICLIPPTREFRLLTTSHHPKRHSQNTMALHREMALCVLTTKQPVCPS